MQMPCTGIAEIEPSSFCYLRGSDSKKIADFCKIFLAGKLKKTHDSASIGQKYANAMHRHSRNRTLDLLSFQGVRQQKNRRFLQIFFGGKIKKFRDSALSGPKYANAMHRHSRNRTLVLLLSQGVRQQKNRRFLQNFFGGKIKKNSR